MNPYLKKVTKVKTLKNEKKKKMISQNQENVSRALLWNHQPQSRFKHKAESQGLFSPAGGGITSSRILGFMRFQIFLMMILSSSFSWSGWPVDKAPGLSIPRQISMVGGSGLGGVFVLALHLFQSMASRQMGMTISTAALWVPCFNTRSCYPNSLPCGVWSDTFWKSCRKHSCEVIFSALWYCIAVAVLYSGSWNLLPIPALTWHKFYSSFIPPLDHLAGKQMILFKINLKENLASEV